ncbi:MAG: basic amino acid/polyamine antiporter, family [Thermoplasmata archaeon]|jgi:APA family basic amino acid/polyamine antiporter|nr:basic amino acid/polyamine antiporter, family [Thermoplasmata archaeon]
MPETAAPPPAPADGLRRELNLFGAVSMIVGIVIGSGIFLGVNRVAAGAGSPWLVVAVWVLGGLLTLMGALTYAELGALFPKAGGEYVFLKEGLGPFAAFLSGWTAFTINLAGSAAALAVVFAAQLDALKPAGFSAIVLLDWGWLRVDGIKLTAACLILFLALVNFFGIRFGGNVQKTLTLLKYSLIVLLAGAALFYHGASPTPHTGLLESPAFTYHAGGGATGPLVTHTGFDLGQFLGLAMVAALFAYDGWTNVVRVGSELRDPGHNLPKAMLIGLGSIMLLYVLVSFGYMNVLGFAGFAQSPKTVASDAAGILFGGAGQRIVAAMILVSVFGSLNGITISGPRIYYAMARDRLFPRRFDQVNRHHVPSRAIWAQALLSIAFLFFFDFEQLTDNVVFISFLFYALAAVGLLVLRRTHPELPRPYKVPGYPWVPLLFIAASLSFVGYLAVQQATGLSASNFSRLAGLLVVLAGVPVYLFFRARQRREARRDGTPMPEPSFGPDRRL